MTSFLLVIGTRSIVGDALYGGWAYLCVMFLNMYKDVEWKQSEHTVIVYPNDVRPCYLGSGG